MLLKKGAEYEHVKTGKRYKLISFAKDSKSLEDMVIYEALYNNNVSKIWVRPKSEFIGEAIRPDGTMHPRFRLVEE